ncbi:MAG: patatin-like phospholipase family protein, partial [Caulobacteraceae bacterium]
SFVGAQLALGRSAASLAEAILAEAERPRPPRGSGDGPADLSPLMTLFERAWSGKEDPTAVRREIGALALSTKTMSEVDFLASFGRSLSEKGGEGWPDRDFRCTAVDAETGAFIVWDKAAKVGVSHAVASSCSVPGVYPPITINGRRYIDGGMRSGTNADLAKGFDKVVLIALRIGGEDVRAQRMARRLDEEIAVLHSGGAQVELILPDPASSEAFGANLMDFRRRPAACRAGEAQGRALAARFASFW